MKPIPKRLKKEPLIEAIWQVQFEPAPDQPVGDLLPGVLYSALKGSHPGLQFHRLPTADIPAPVAQIDPNLRFAAKFRMEEPDSPYLFQVGDRVITVNCRKPYAGWMAFREKIIGLIDIIQKSGFVPTPQRHSLRYIDLLTLEPSPDLSSLQLAMQLGAYEVSVRPLQMRIEIAETDCLHVVQIATPAQAYLPEGATEGTIVDLETLTQQAPEGWVAIKTQIDHLHGRSKELFFQNILTEKAIERLDPEY